MHEAKPKKAVIGSEEGEQRSVQVSKQWKAATSSMAAATPSGTPDTGVQPNTGTPESNKDKPDMGISRKPNKGPSKVDTTVKKATSGTKKQRAAHPEPTTTKAPVRSSAPLSL